MIKKETVVKEYIFEDDRPFKSCHASTLVALDQGDVLVSWFGGTAEKDSDVAIWISRRSGTTGEWSKPLKIADEEGIAHWNPVLYVNRSGKILLFYKVGHEITEWFTRMISSTDNGYTWMAPVELVPGDIGGRGPVRNKPIELACGTILAPASIERPDFSSASHPIIWESFVDISYDQGETWTRSHKISLPQSMLGNQNPFHSRGLIQPTLWQSNHLDVHMLIRSTEGFIFRSDSTDKGKTWSEAYPISVPNNNSGIDLVKLDNGYLLLVCTPISGMTTSSARTPLVLLGSTDNGRTWKEEFVLEDHPGEYSYPAIITKDKQILITYTWKRERVAFWSIQYH